MLDGPGMAEIHAAQRQVRGLALAGAIHAGSGGQPAAGQDPSVAHSIPGSLARSAGGRAYRHRSAGRGDPLDGGGHGQGGRDQCEFGSTHLTRTACGCIWYQDELFSERPINDGRIQFLFMLDLSEDSGSDRKPKFSSTRRAAATGGSGAAAFTAGLFELTRSHRSGRIAALMRLKGVIKVGQEFLGRCWSRPLAQPRNAPYPTRFFH